MKSLFPIILGLLLCAAPRAMASVNVTVNGSTYVIPQTNEKGWGTNVTNWIQGISANTLQPTGGSFPLTNDVNFGSSFGPLAPYYKSATSNISTAGALRLAKTDSVGWRNNANGANLLLGIDGSDNLTFNSVIIPTATSASVQDSTFRIYDNGDSTKKIAFEASSITTGTTRTITVPDQDVNLGILSATGNAKLNGFYLSNDGGNEGFSVDNSGGVTITHASNTPQITAGANSTAFYLTGANNFSGSNSVPGTVELQTGVGTGTGAGQVKIWTPLLKASGSTHQDTLHLGLTVISTSTTQSQVQVTDTLAIGAPSGATGAITFWGTTSGSTVLQAQDAAGSTTFKLPNADGSAGQVMKTNGSGVLGWVSPFTNPMTTTGDSVYSSDNSGTPARQGIGTNAQYQTVWNGLPSWQSYQPTTAQSLTSGTQYSPTYSFTLSAAASLTAGWTYTNNSKTCTVAQTTSSSTNVLMTCTGDPTVSSSGTLTCSSCGATGDRTYTYWVKPKFIAVTACGGGGGGGASTSPTGGSGGGTTTWNSTTISCTGGGVGTDQGTPGVASAGVCTLSGVPSATTQLVWNVAGAGGTSGNGVANASGMVGANSMLGMGGAGGTPSSGNGFAGSGFGAGGGGAGANGATNGPGGGGGSGACAKIIVFAPASGGYAYTIGGAGSARTGTRSGGAGSQGGIIVEEYF